MANAFSIGEGKNAYYSFTTQGLIFLTVIPTTSSNHATSINALEICHVYSRSWSIGVNK